MQGYILWKCLNWALCLSKCLCPSSLCPCLSSLLFPLLTVFKQQHFILALLSSPLPPSLPNNLASFSFHFCSFNPTTCHPACPPSLQTCNLFHCSSVLCCPLFSADVYVQCCEWQAAVWLWCGLTVVCLHCHWGSFLLTRLPFHPVWTRLAAWLAGHMPDWLLGNWGSSINAHTCTFIHTPTTTSLS